MKKRKKHTRPRAAASSYGRVEKHPKRDRWKAGEPITQEERVSIALTRLRSARSRAAAHPTDVVLRAAVEARHAEWQLAQLALDRMIERRRA